MDKSTVEQIYEFVARFVTQNGYSPSIREIAAGVGVFPTTVRYHLWALQEAGRITMEPRSARTVRIVAQ